MAVARTGVYSDDYLEYSSTLAADMRRLLSTIRELDDRVDEGKIPSDELAIIASPVPIANKGEKKSRGI